MRDSILKILLEELKVCTYSGQVLNTQYLSGRIATKLDYNHNLISSCINSIILRYSYDLSKNNLINCENITTEIEALFQ